jgi:hypothetical protein
MGALRIVACTLLAGLVGAAEAAAAPGFLGRGHDPGVAVDGAGTAHVAWLAEAGDAGSLEYCQVPRGKRSCALRRSIPLEDDGFGKVQVLLPRPGTVQIVAPLLNPAALASSFDGGGTFAVTALGGDGTPAIEKAIYGPGESISIMSGSGGASFGRFNPDGSGPSGLPVTFGSATESLETSLAPWGAGFAAFFSGLRARSVLWNGAGDPNLPQSWVEGPSLGRADEPEVVGGRSGTWVAYLRRGRDKTYVRRLRSSGRLGAERRLLRDVPLDHTFAQGPRGHLALVYAMVWDSVWVVRSRNGRRWARPKRLFRGNDPQDLRSALGPRGGWLVWDGNPGNAGSHTIRIAAIPGPPRR